METSASFEARSAPLSYPREMSSRVSECLVGRRTLCQRSTDISSFLLTAVSQTANALVLGLDGRTGNSPSSGLAPNQLRQLLLIRLFQQTPRCCDQDSPTMRISWPPQRRRADVGDRRFPAFQLPTPAEPGLGAANPRVIQLDVSMQRFSAGVDHGPPELVEEQPRGFVSSQAQLPLQPQGRGASFVGDHQIAGPEPDRQRRFRVVKDRARRQRHLMAASGALPASMGDRIGPSLLAPRTHESVRPATGGQILLAGVLGRKLTLELVQILRKRRARHAPTLQIVAC